MACITRICDTLEFENWVDSKWDNSTMDVIADWQYKNEGDKFRSITRIFATQVFVNWVDSKWMDSTIEVIADGQAQWESMQSTT